MKVWTWEQQHDHANSSNHTLSHAFCCYWTWWHFCYGRWDASSTDAASTQDDDSLPMDSSAIKIDENAVDEDTGAMKNNIELCSVCFKK